jgi:glycosyltransferase involved in cell wall biosynthesis
LNEEIVENAAALIVHSDFVRKKIAAKTDKPVVKINHHGHAIKNFDSRKIRNELGVNENDILICSAGFINKNKRYDVILTALNEIGSPRIKYLIAGKDRGNLLDNILDGKTANVLRRDHLPIEELEGVICASDICVNLRYPTMGESSGSLLRMMGYGKPVLVTNFGSYSEFPDYCVLKIDPDLDEKEIIKRFVIELLEDPDFRSSIGREASEYVKRECGIAKCAREYAEFLRESG